MRRRISILLILLGGLIPFAALLWIIFRPDPVTLRWQFRKGEVWRYLVTNQTKIISSCTYSMTVLDVDHDGTATIQCKCEAASTRASTWDYDSRRDLKEPTHVVERAYFLRLHKTMTIRMNPLGYVVEVDGVAAGSLGKQGFMHFPIDTFIYPHQFSLEGHLVWHLPLPQEPIAPGDSWSLDLEVRGPVMPHEDRFTRSFHLSSLSRAGAKISMRDRFAQSRQSYLDKADAKIERVVNAVFSVAQGKLLSYTFEQSLRSGNPRSTILDSLEVKLIPADGP